MNRVTENQTDYFAKLYAEHKGTTMATSSESLAHKKCRYDQISGVFKNEADFTLHDIGCGLGEFAGYLDAHHPQKNIVYSGSEIVTDLVKEASDRYPRATFMERDLASDRSEDVYDYLILSGVFHQRRTTPIPAWEKYLQTLVSRAFSMSRRGIAFNVVSPFVDFYLPELYYCNISKLINFVNDDLSRFFEIKHNYALFEMTIFVYQPEYTKNLSENVDFEKYFHRDLDRKS